MTLVLQSMDWKPRELVGPDTVPKLTVFEDRIDAAIKNHMHGKAIKYEGETPVYSSIPLNTHLIPISDANNRANLSLANHLQDAIAHSTWAGELPQLKVMFTSIPLHEMAGGSGPDYEEGTVTESWKHVSVPLISQQPTQHGRLLCSYGVNQGYYLNGAWMLGFQGCQQAFGSPIPFRQRTPMFGRVFQKAFFHLSGSGIGAGAPYPTVSAFDYIVFPYRTWFMLYEDNYYLRNYSYDRTVVKRYRTQTFPDGYRCDRNSLRILHQLRQVVGHTFKAQSNADPTIYWPEGAQWDKLGVPNYVRQGYGGGAFGMAVPNAGQYDEDPSNMIRQYVGQEGYGRKVTIVPDWSTFENARRIDVWGLFDQYYNAWRELRQVFFNRQQSEWYDDPFHTDNWYKKQADWMLPLDDTDSFSFRLLHNMPTDNQLDLFPLSMVGFVVVLPYGYLPLYVKNIDQMGAGEWYYNDLGRAWATLELGWAPGGSRIQWVQPPYGSQDYLLPQLVAGSDVGKTNYGYHFPEELWQDIMLIGPDETT